MSAAASGTRRRTGPEVGPESIAAGRAAIYSALARCFLDPPDARLLGTLRDRLLPVLAGDPAAAGRGVAAEARALRALLEDAGGRAAPDALAAEFTRLFRGLRPGDSPLPPYESLYLQGGRLFAASAVEVRGEYARHGLAPAGAHAGEPPDHLGLELALLGALCERERRALGEGDEAGVRESAGAQRKFIGSHVGLWLSEFRAEVERRDGSGFYSSLLRLAEAWVSSERERLGAEPGAAPRSSATGVGD